ncbi:MAG: lasso RiPP family leader peptide-containing protein [Solirubrobacterales bacterium]|nr:lasso RiPP family leader peptide-containing protein [Solirubrobacterales bacterium]
MAVEHASVHRKPYTTPRLVVYGDVAEITQGPNLGIADVIIGVVTTGTPGDGGFYCPGKPWPQTQPCS